MLLLVTLTQPGQATDNTAQELLATAKKTSSLFQDENKPFQMDVGFSGQVNTPVQGHFTLKWQTPARWWRKISMANFEQIDIRIDDKLYTSRNLDFTPIRVRELIALLEFAERPENTRIKKQKEQTENGVSLLCLHLESKKWVKDRELCLNSTSHEIVSEDWLEPPDQRRRERFTEYFDFGNLRFPRKLELIVNGSRAIAANVESLTASPFDDSLLRPPKGALERRQCKDMVHPIPVRTPDPMYPKSASQNKISGDTVVAMTVFADGTVGDIQVIGSAARSMDEATLQTLKGWKFKPAMCGSEPVVSDIEVVVSFRVN